MHPTDDDVAIAGSSASTTSALTTTLTGPGRLFFQWQYSLEKNQFKAIAIVRINGEAIEERQRAFNWEAASVAVGPGQHTIAFELHPFSSETGDLAAPQFLLNAVDWRSGANNESPTIQVSGKTNYGVGEAYGLTVDISDVDGDLTALTATNLPTGMRLRSKDRDSFEILGSANLNQRGVHELQFAVTDGAETASETVAVIILNPYPEGFVIEETQQFEESPPIDRRYLGSSVIADEGHVFAAAANPINGQGPTPSVFHFQLQDDVWRLADVITSPVSTAEEPRSLYGAAIAFSDGILVVGAPGEGNPDGFRQGAAYFYETREDTWIKGLRLTQPALEDIFFGRTVALDNGVLAVASNKALYLYSVQGSNTISEPRILNLNATAIAMSNQWLAIMDNSIVDPDQEGLPSRGIVHLYRLDERASDNVSPPSPRHVATLNPEVEWLRHSLSENIFIHQDHLYFGIRGWDTPDNNSDSTWVTIRYMLNTDEETATNPVILPIASATGYAADRSLLAAPVFGDNGSGSGGVELYRTDADGAHLLARLDGSDIDEYDYFARGAAAFAGISRKGIGVAWPWVVVTAYGKKNGLDALSNGALYFYKINDWTFQKKQLETNAVEGAPGSDLDFNGIPDLVQFWRAPHTHQPFQIRGKRQINDVLYQTFAVHTNSSAAGIHWQIETSSDLVSWTTEGVILLEKGSPSTWAVPANENRAFVRAVINDN